MSEPGVVRAEGLTSTSADDLCRRAMDASSDAFAIVDAHDRYLYANAAHAKIVQVAAAKSLLDQRLTDHFGAGAAQACLIEALQRCRNGEAVRLECTPTSGDENSRLEVVLESGSSEPGMAGEVFVRLSKSARPVDDRVTGLSHRQLKTVFDNAPFEVFVKDLDGRYAFVNTRFANRFGRGEAEIVGLLEEELVGGEAAALGRSRDAEVMRSGQTVTHESRRYCGQSDEELQTALVVRFPIYDADGAPRGCAGVVTDISDRIRAEDALRESESRFRNLIEGSLQGVLVQRDGVVLFANTALAEMFGYQCVDALYELENIEHLAAVHERSRLDDFERRRLAGHAAPVHFEFDGLRHDGSSITLLSSARVVNWHGAPAVQSTLFDITETKRIEAALRNSRETLRAVIDAVPAMISAVDVDQRVLFVNEAQARVLGTSFRDAPGKTIRELTDESFGKYDAELNERVIFGGKPIPFFEEEFVGKDDVERVLLTTKTPLPDGLGNQRVATISLDISDRKTAEREREQLIEELEARNAELERFSYTVSHDLRSPLITIRGFIGLLEQDIRSGDGVLIAKDLAQIHLAAGRMQALLRDLLALSQVGQLMHTPAIIALDEVVEDALQRVFGAGTEQSPYVHVQPGLPSVYADRTRLVEVYQNLIENAAKFTSTTAAPRIEIGCRSGPPGPVLFVKDNGIGIAPSYHEKVFGLFERLNPESADGTGIGLALVRRIILGHGGQAWVESDGVGHGTTLCFTLPEQPQVRSR